MKTTSRIPSLQSKSYYAMNKWFEKMDSAGLLYHPDERAADIVDIKTNEPMFNVIECEALDTLINQMFESHGDDVYKVCLKLVRRVVKVDAVASKVCI